MFLTLWSAGGFKVFVYYKFMSWRGASSHTDSLLPQKRMYSIRFICLKFLKLGDELLVGGELQVSKAQASKAQVSM
jgi:hypothetical protein